MRTQFKTGVAFLTAVLFAVPLTAGAADKSDKASSTMDKATDKAKETTNEAKGAVSDSWLTSKTTTTSGSRSRAYAVPAARSSARTNVISRPPCTLRNGTGRPGRPCASSLRRAWWAVLGGLQSLGSAGT